ncbi:MAG: hypothetical protein ACQETJ_07150 [Bacteroidota bacterium]
MKNLKTILTGIALIFISVAVLATGNLKVNILPAGKDKSMVQILNVEKSNYEIELRNERGDVVFYKQTDAPASTYIKHYNFAMLKDGNYSLTVKTNDEKLENALKLNNGQVESMNQKREAAPYFTVNDNRLELSYLNFGLENLRVMVYDNNTLLYEKELNPEFTVNYGLDLSNLKSGKYDAVLTAGNSSYEYQITK